MIRRHIRARGWEVAVLTTAWVSKLLLLITFASAVAFALVGAEEKADQTIAPVIPGICLAVITVAMVGLTLQLAYTYAVPHPQDQSHKGSNQDGMAPAPAPAPEPGPAAEGLS
jgi:hypothetical protein